MITELQNLSEEDILGLTLIGEARGEPIEGIVGVASVIRNRVQIKYNGATDYISACLADKQFSCWNPTDPNFKYLLSIVDLIKGKLPIKDIALNQCFLVAQGIVDWKIKDNTKGSTHYVTQSLYHSITCPSWARQLKVTTLLGSQVFLV